MRIELYEGEIIVSYKDEEENLPFIRDISFNHLLGGFVRGFINKRIVFDVPVVIAEAKRHGVEVDAAVYEHLERKEAERRAQYEKEQAEKERQSKEKDWQIICKNGCPEKCKNLRRDGDDFVCRVTGELLEEKNLPKYKNGVYVLFNYTPMPSSKCPFNPNLNKEQ